jgi:mono/diheme cytochrome c family protein
VADLKRRALAVSLLLSAGCVLLVEMPCQRVSAQTMPGASEGKDGSSPQQSIAKVGPAKAASGNVAAGMKLFRQNNCSMCHPAGENNLNPLKPLKGSGFSKKYTSDKLLSDHIRCGSPGTGMPAFPKSQISDAELRDIIAYIRSLTPAGSLTPVKKTSKKSA